MIVISGEIYNKYQISTNHIDLGTERRLEENIFTKIHRIIGIMC